MFELIAFDADDTLWNNEMLYTRAKQDFEAALTPYYPQDKICPVLDEVEVNNLAHYGYGIKSFTLSMIETAMAMMGDRLSGVVIERIFEISKAILAADIEILPGVEATLGALAEDHKLMLLTKGDHFEQQRKIDRSNLVRYFQAVEIVGNKTPAAYQAILDKYQVRPADFLMIGNSLRSDILPVLKIGGEAVYVPYPNTWDHENIPAKELVGFSYYELDAVEKIPDLLSQLNR